jgi:hypothetical protein
MHMQKPDKEEIEKHVSLKAGFAEADITPGRDASLMGYGFRAPGNDGARGPLTVRACAFRDGETLAILVVADLAVIPTDVAAELRKAIAERESVPEANVIVAATHTHSGPYPEGDYLGVLRDAVVDTAHRAAGLMFPCTLWHRESAMELGYNRRATAGDVLNNCWGPQEWPDRHPEPMPDTTFSVVLLRQTNGPRSYVLWGTGAHPVVLGRASRSISADYPGEACRLIECYMPDSKAVFVLGGAGNVHPWVATQEDPSGVECVARAAASFAALLTHAVAPVCLQPEQPVLQCVAEETMIGGLRVPLTVWRLGTVRVVALPVELFSELSADLRERLSSPMLLATVANGWMQYWLTDSAAREGGYEFQSAVEGFQPGMGEELVDAVLRLAERL